MKFRYRAFDLKGRQLEDVLDAATLGEAEEQLRKQRLFVVEIAARSIAGGASDDQAFNGRDASGGERASRRFGGGKRGGGRTTRLKEVSGFMRQLAVLVSTGTPMVDSIAALERQVSDGRWKSTVENIRQRLEEGQQLSEAMSAHPEYFDSVCRSLIAAGESGGQMDEMLKRLSQLVRQQLKVRSSILGAMVYPALLICVSIGVLCAMFGFVLPRFEGLFQTLDAPLPPTTKLLMGISEWLKAWWWLAIGGAVGLGFGAKVYLSTPGGRLLLHRTLVRLPQFGKVFRALATARIARVLGVLLEGKVPLLEALQLTRDVTGNLCYSAVIRDAEDRVMRGESVSTALAQSGLIPQAVVEAIRSGEKTGRLATVLTSVADYLDEDNEVIVRSLSSIIEPIILLGLGVMVGFVAISMFLPLFDLTSGTTGGGGGGAP